MMGMFARRGRAIIARLSIVPIAALAPALADARVFDPETFTLSNGLEVVVIGNPRAPVVTHQLWYRVGAADEPAGKSGVAHFLEHLMFKATRNLESGQFSEIISRNGGRENAFTSWDYTGYFQTIAKDRLGLMMRWEADRMTNLLFDRDEIEAERQVVLEERRSRTDNSPAAQLGEALNAAMYRNHPYGLPIVGWEHEIRAIGRADLAAFYETWYAPNNAVLIVSGDVTAAEVRALAEQHYGPVPPRLVPERARPTEPPLITRQTITLRNARVAQPSWRRAWLAPSVATAEEPGDAYALTVLSQILGGGGTSRLYASLVVERGIATSAGSYYDSDGLNTRSFVVYASPRTSPDAGAGSLEDSIPGLASAVTGILRNIVENGVTPDELARAKKRLAAAAIFARDSLNGPARAFGAALTAGLSVEEVEAWPRRIAAVTVEDVNRMAKAILGQRGHVTGVLLPEDAS